MASQPSTTAGLMIEFENSNLNKEFLIFNRNNKGFCDLSLLIPVVVVEVTSFPSLPAGFALAEVRLSVQDMKYYHICGIKLSVSRNIRFFELHKNGSQSLSSINLSCNVFHAEKIQHQQTENSN